MSSTGETTKRESDSELGSNRPKSLALEWVFPESRRDSLTGSRVVGRGDECDLQIASEGSSRRHVEIRREGPIHTLRDLGSTNGTFLNGARVRHAPVARGDVLRVGNWVGLFTDDEGESKGFGELAPELLGGNELRAALSGVREAAGAGLPVLLIGATGTGKERVARAIHGFTGRSGPFQAVNCAALPVNLAEAELFGYRRGAFSGAEQDSKGHFRQAAGGTLFLDEVIELPIDVQAKLLRTVEDRQVAPLGGGQALSVDIQVVAAAQRPLEELVAEGRFREDLAARLTGFVVNLPALAERKADIPRLFERFLRVHSGGRAPALDAKLVENLCLYRWPHNVRELEMLARRLLAQFALEPVLARRHLPAEFRSATSASTIPPKALQASRRDQDLEQLVRALRACRGNVTRAAELAGFSRQRAYRLLGGRPVSEFLGAEAGGLNGHSVVPPDDE
jgi:sigma-54 dependent transcriptional regulator, acetoin dehydrogenase operon transcriptional activator AcoR